MNRRAFLSMLGLAPLAPIAVAAGPAIPATRPVMAFFTTDKLLSPDALNYLEGVMKHESMSPLRAVPMMQFGEVYPPHQYTVASNRSGRSGDAELGMVELGDAGDDDTDGSTAILPDQPQAVTVESVADDIGCGTEDTNGLR